MIKAFFVSGESGSRLKYWKYQSWGIPFIAILMLFISAGCEEVKPLTPEQQSLVSAWSVGKSLEKAFAGKSVDEVMALLGPPLSTQPETRPQLERLFSMFDRLDLSLVMDSGVVDPATRSITFMAHWTVTGTPIKKNLPPYFQTGECRMVVSVRQAPNPSKVETLTGDTFLAAPAQPGPPT